MESSADASTERAGAARSAHEPPFEGAALAGELRARIAQELATRALPVLLVLSVLGLIVTGLAAPEDPWRLVSPALAIVAVAAGMWAARRWPLATAAGMILAAIVVVTIGVMLNGGIRAPIYVGSFAIVVGAANLFGSRMAIATGIGMVAIGGVAVVAESSGWLGSVAVPPARLVFLVDAAWMAVIVAFAALPVRVLTATIRESEAARRQAADSRAREEHQRRLLETLFDNARHAAGLLDDTGRVRVMNRAMMELLDVEPGEAAGGALTDLPALSGVDVKIVDAALSQARGGARAMIQVRWGSGGDERYVDLALRPALDNASTGDIVVEARDRTEVERVRAALNVEQQRYEAVFQHANDAIFLMRGDRFIACNPRTCELFACTTEDVIGATPMDFSPLLQPDGRPSQEVAREFIAAAFAGEPQRFDWQHQRMDGSLVDCEVSLNVVDIGGARHVVALVRDMGERRELEARLRHAERLDSIGQLAGGVAHDFNNLLAAILGATDVMRIEASGNAEIQPWLQMIDEACRRAADLTQQLLRFARRGLDERGPVSVREVIEGAAALLERTIDKRVEIVLELDPKVDRVIGGATALQSAVLNLGINASHAMPDGGAFRVVTRELVVTDEGREPWLNGVASGRYVHIVVTDTGMGIPPEVIDRVFDPFFTTKDQGKGTGLGLAAVYGTVRQHGGAIAVASEVGEGTRFDIALPLVDLEEPAVVGVDDDAAVPGSGRILVVDDEPALRRAARRLLESCGYEVLEAVDGADAVRVFDAERPDVVLLDLVMPVMGGRDCFERIRAVDPDARVIALTGYGPSEDLDAMREAGLAGVVPKPYGRRELTRALADARLVEQPRDEATSS